MNPVLSCKNGPGHQYMQPMSKKYHQLVNGESQ